MTESTDPQFETITCPLCESGEFRHLVTGEDRLYRVPGEFQLVRCSGCRHVYLNPRPTLKNISRYYPDEYGPHQFDEQNPNTSSTEKRADGPTPTPM